MAKKLTEEDGRRALREHLVDRAQRARVKYGLYMDHDVMRRLLEDREFVRYPTELVFDAAALDPGEFAHAEPIGATPADGFRLVVHPWFETQLENLPLLVAYHIIDINYGDIATAAEAELFGATLLGLEVEAYYEALCELTDSIPPDPGSA
ncbi:MAG: hypothetical protein GY715_01170 [Planctomycetes bacterium]|nr:hypothetical protein [Planctomycetota bacterium]